MDWVFHAFPVLMLLVGLAVSLFDMRYRRIPNKVILIGLAIAFIWHSFAPPGTWAFDSVNAGSVGFLRSVAASLAMLAIFLPFWVFRMLGAGDVKLLALVGAAFGASPQHWSHLFVVLFYIAVTGGLLVLGMVLFTGRIGLIFRNLRLISLSVLARQHSVNDPVFDASVDTAARMPYGVAIVVGSTAFVLSERFL